jgi:hypothetical protein
MKEERESDISFFSQPDRFGLGSQTMKIMKPEQRF